MIRTSANANFTTPQKHALDSSRNLGVRANAGSGKTSVLVDRIIQILEQNRPADENEFTPGPTPAFSIENIVSITFTKKAAGELKARLMKLLQELEVQSVEHVKSGGHNKSKNWKMLPSEPSIVSLAVSSEKMPCWMILRIVLNLILN